MTCTADSDYIRAISVRYRRCPSSYSVRSAVSRAGFEATPLHRPRTAHRTVPSCAQPRAQTARAQREKTRLLEELMFFYGRGVHDSFSFSHWKASSPERTKTPLEPASDAGTTFITDSTTQDRPDTKEDCRERPRDVRPTSRSAVTLGCPWSSQNEALRQMCKASERRPRHRFFPRGSFLPKCTKT